MASSSSTFLTVLCLAGGVVLGGWLGPRMILEGRATADWEVQPGELLAASIDRETVRGSGHHYLVKARYRYPFEGRSYESTQVVAGGPAGFGSRPQAEALLADLEGEDPLLVRVDPKAPEQAVLRAGVPPQAWILTLLGMGLLLLGLKDIFRKK